MNLKICSGRINAIAGALEALGGLIVTSRLDSAQPNASMGMELGSIAAVVHGGTSLYGRKGTIMGTVQGALITGVLNNGHVLMNVSPFWQRVVKGLVILMEMVIAKMNSKNDKKKPVLCYIRLNSHNRRSFNNFRNSTKCISFGTKI